ncbi:tubby-related protein 4 [Aplysia californica]|uniref:Tubby-related protein 4 n=1 Tax=Aplysia californica TaxID=6500 RepID=A0ABM0JZB2_APLCA|nr:tubby-related protein 4 [Aplysia californica]XP_012941699.1 tubby-related protein 4 [Aplysia californica]
MHVHFEQNTCTRTDSNFLSLSWMGKVPEDLPEEGRGWKLEHSQYYVEGWLASGNARGVVGVTFSTSHCHKYEAPPRSNFNLRGHRSEVVLVRWNEPYQKLATCDSRGVIFVWIKHEGRWSIELVNDRDIEVTDFAWSHDGRMALICYRDGFILVGSVAGQRYWSSMLNLNNTSITCGVWSPDDQQVIFGTLDGQIIVMSSAGSVVSQVSIHEGSEITSMAWSCERFNMAEADRSAADNTSRGSESSGKSHVLAVCFKYGDIFLMSGYDDVCPVMVYTTLTGVKIDWSNCGEYLAVGGFVRLPNLQCRNEVHFYSKDGILIHWVTIPSQGKPLAAMTWGHNDKRLFLAAGCHMYVAWVSKQVAPLHFLCQRVLHQAVRTEKAVDKLPIPQRLRCGVKALFSPTIKSYIPDPLRLREFVCSPPPGGERLFCTMIRHGEETSGGHYTLYLEYLGGLVPLLKGKRASKLRPDFIIFDPKIKSSSKVDPQPGNAIESDSSSESEAEVYTDGCGSPRMQRRRRHKVFRAEKVNRSITFRTLDELMYDDNLPETTRLVEVTSNIWGTKFQITSNASCLPVCLGQVVYKTSLLHLQPRQMTITISEISPARYVLSRDPNFTPAPVSDDEDSFWTSEGDLVGEKKTVEVTVHDAQSLSSVDHGSRRNSSSVVETGVRPTGTDTPLIEHSLPLNGDLSSLAGKLSSSGTVRSRSLSPVRNSLTQSAPAFKPEGVSVDGRQDGNTGTSMGWQGARPKANLTNKKSNNKDSSSNSSSIISSSNNSSGSPKMGASNSIKFAAVAGSGAQVVSSNHSASQYANSPGSLSHSSPPCANRVEAFPLNATSSPVIGHKKIENHSGFKRLDIEIGVQGIDLVTVGGSLSSGQRKPEESSTGSLAQQDSSSSSVSTASSESVLISALDIGPTCSQRWAEPVPQPVKLSEDELSTSELAFENNLVADCSPTAPSCLNLQRRLYLAQQNIMDTSSPISPSSCPSCLPAHLAALLPHGAGLSDQVTQQNFRNSSGLSSASRSSEHSWFDPSPLESEKPKDKSLGASAITHSVDAQRTSSSSSHHCSDIRDKQGGDSDMDSASGHASARANVCRNCRAQQDDTVAAQQTGSSGTSSSSSSVLSSATASGGGSGSDKSQDHCNPSAPVDKTFLCRKAPSKDSYSSLAPHETTRVLPPASSSSPSCSQPQSSPAASTDAGPSMTRELSSLDRLHRILSEEPSAQYSAHNFRSMPGFVMKNPDLINGDDDDDLEADLSSPDQEDILEDDLPGSYLLGNSLLDSDVHDLEIQQTSASLPSSPVRFGVNKQNNENLQEELLKGRCKHLSPLLGRKAGPRDSQTRSQDVFLEDYKFSQAYHSLEAFQKAQLRNKMRKRMTGSSGRMEQGRTFTMHNKAPLWNETSQVYQLDFGGRVTQESAKNFQIELRGKQVMQFGRIDNNAYTLDFQCPFTTVQAFAVALANVTQRLK